ncbi:acetyltransferase [Halococcus morrhuae DSM 1307]|uniref:Acetyltransferase n=1 Tax=Halococcus morrhuae DSM 1307 TaxID=931277 RepID=M0MMD1_HALMO|nr:GNAT family N-acetyltransferase [Halococcus morrhuae]EMA46857.1 acetyltransferase [Halococcus morrhuae DSM 1307]
MVTVRRAKPEDAHPLSQLLETNTKENLTPEEREEGYITGGGPPEDALATMAAEPGFPVAADGGDVIGCIGASTFDQHEKGVVETMADACAEADFRGESLSTYQTFLYGPAIVAQGHRGNGVLSEMFEALVEIVAGEFEIGLGWVANENEASYAAHTDGLGMIPVTEFEFDDDQYTVVAFLVSERES